MIDASQSERIALVRYLEDRRYRVEMVETVDAARRYLESKRPNVIFLDDGLRGVDGLGALRALRQNPLTSGVAIVLSVAKRIPDMEAQARAAGANAVLLKPSSPEQIQRVLEEIERDGRRSESDAPFISPTPTPSAGSRNASSPALRPLRVSPSLPSVTPLVPLAVPAPSAPSSVVLADPGAVALSTPADDLIREQLESRMRRVSQGLLVQFAEIKDTVAQLAHQQAKLAEEPSTVRTELRIGLDETHQALRLVTSRIEGIERDVFSQLTEMRTHLDAALKAYGDRVADLAQHARQAAAEEAQVVAERTVMSAALRISDQLADAILGAARR